LSVTTDAPRAGPSKRNVLRLAAAAAVALAVIVVVSVLTGGTVTGSPCQASSALVGKRVTTFTAPGLSSGTVSAPWSRHHAGVVIFFASWCGPCQREMPGVSAYLRAHSLAPVDVVGVDAFDDRGAAQRFVAGAGVAFPVIFDPNSRVTSRDFGFQYVPETAFVDPSGVVKMVYYGAISTSCLMTDVAVLKAG
jgi:thiol-disulfide isomerase/thioredoxin